MYSNACGAVCVLHAPGYTGRVVATSPCAVYSDPSLTNSCCQLAVVEVDGEELCNAHPLPQPEVGAGRLNQGENQV